MHSQIVFELHAEYFYISPVPLHDIDPDIVQPDFPAIIRHNKELRVDDIFVILLKLLFGLPSKEYDQFSFVESQVFQPIYNNLPTFVVLNNF